MSQPKLQVKYELTIRFGDKCHIWSVVGAAGGLHLHITEPKEDSQRRPHGGFEIHRRKPYGDSHDAPTHKDCWLVGGPCWHDGSSLWADEYWIPRWKNDPQDHDGMFERLRVEYANQFMRTDDQ
jgi:hypothetical protein